MDESKRKFIKTLPMAAVAGATMTVGSVTGTVVEVKPEKKYILQLEGDYFTQEDLDGVRSKLQDEGFSNMLVVAGNVNIYELV